MKILYEQVKSKEKREHTRAAPRNRHRQDRRQVQPAQYQEQ